MNFPAIAATAMQVASNLGATEFCTLHMNKAVSYDYITDKSTLTGGDDPTVEGIFYREKQTQGAELTVERAQFLIKQADVPSRVRESATVTRNLDNAVWQVDDVDYIPTQAVCIIYLRK